MSSSAFSIAAQNVSQLFNLSDFMVRVKRPALFRVAVTIPRPATRQAGAFGELDVGLPVPDNDRLGSRNFRELGSYVLRITFWRRFLVFLNLRNLHFRSFALRQAPNGISQCQARGGPHFFQGSSGISKRQKRVAHGLPDSAERRSQRAVKIENGQAVPHGPDLGGRNYKNCPL